MRARMAALPAPKPARGISFAGEERAVAALTLELAQAGIGLRALVPRTATLEELFFRMTEGEPEPAMTLAEVAA